MSNQPSNLANKLAAVPSTNNNENENETETEAEAETKTETNSETEVISDLTKYTTILKNYSEDLNNFLLKNNLIESVLGLYEKNMIEKKDNTSKQLFYHFIIKSVIYFRLYSDERKEIFNGIVNGRK